MLNITMRIINFIGHLLICQLLFSAFCMSSLPEKHLLFQGHCDEDDLLYFKDLNSSPSPDIQFSHERDHQDGTSLVPRLPQRFVAALWGPGQGRQQAYSKSLLYEEKLYTSFRDTLVLFSLWRDHRSEPHYKEGKLMFPFPCPSGPSLHSK